SQADTVGANSTPAQPRRVGNSPWRSSTRATTPSPVPCAAPMSPRRARGGGSEGFSMTWFTPRRTKKYRRPRMVVEQLEDRSVPATLSGYVYSDLNNNGVKDATEPGINGVNVRLTGIDSNGSPVSQSTNTSSTGAYSFNVTRAGTYKITEFTQPAA